MGWLDTVTKALKQVGKGEPGTAAEARQWVQKGALLLDVRTPEEHRAASIPGSVNIPVQELDRRLSELGSPERPVVLYCRSGGRSARACQVLRAAGFRQLLDLGPMSAWS